MNKKTLLILSISMSLVSCKLFDNSSSISSSSSTTSSSESSLSTNSEISTTDSSTISTVDSSSIDSSSYSDSSISITDSSSSSSESSTDSSTTIEEKETITFKLSSIFDELSSDLVNSYRMYAYYDDTYNITIDAGYSFEIYDESETILVENTDSSYLFLNKDQIITLKVYGSMVGNFNLSVRLLEHSNILPYDINTSIDYEKMKEKAKQSSTSNPNKSVDLKVNKRTSERSLYVNANNPEKLQASNMNKCLSMQDVTNKDVFFTFEHNNIVKNFFYGYKVNNVGEEDLYITVKNLGLQVNGAGSWLGDDEWIQFYNTNFRVNNYSNYTSDQKNVFDAMVGFTNKRTAKNYSPITYRIPKGKHIYVMGGTSNDAYKNINVFDTAGIKATSGCSNGAVLFETYGSKATGQFMVYTTYSNVKNISTTDFSVQEGYVAEYGAQLVGYDTCDGVVDTDLSYTINDKTPSGYLKVTYDNPFYVSPNRRSEKASNAYLPFENFQTQSFDKVDSWVSHINPNYTTNAVGTDMTRYISIDSVSKKEVILDYLSRDGRGKLANIGNWMVDYQDNICIANQGESERTLKYTMKFNGVILGFVRNYDGTINANFQPRFFVKTSYASYPNGSINDDFVYEVKIPSHSAIFFTVDYNLLANSNGYISHQLYLS